ncbi:Spermatogenesis-associated protein 9, partial [Varanus komodoensis]
QSNRTVQKPRSVITRELSSTHGAIIMNGLTKLSRSSKSVAKFLQPRFARKITELSMISHHFLETLNSPKQPLYGMKDRTMFFYDVISYPARTALTSVMCVSYAALIYLAVSINTMLGKIKSIIQTESASRESSSDGVDADRFPRANEAAHDSATTPQEPSEFSVKSTPRGSIHTLLAAMDQEQEQEYSLTE